MGIFDKYFYELNSLYEDSFVLCKKNSSDNDAF